MLEGPWAAVADIEEICPRPTDSAWLPDRDTLIGNKKLALRSRAKYSDYEQGPLEVPFSPTTTKQKTVLSRYMVPQSGSAFPWFFETPPVTYFHTFLLQIKPALFLHAGTGRASE